MSRFRSSAERVRPAVMAALRAIDRATRSAMTGDTNPSEIILNIIEDAASDLDAGTAVIAERVALSMARSAAITAGRALSAEERNRLIGDLLQLPSPNFTPDGLPIIKMLSDEDLSRLF